MAAYARRQFNGGAITTTVPLVVGSGDTSFTLAASTNWPDGSSGNFIVVIDQSSPEKILCSSRSGLVVTVAASGRGYDGTSAVSHVAGSQIQCVHSAQDDDEANQVVSAVLGQSGAAKGDILTMLSAAGPNTLTRVPIGSTNQGLIVASGLPAWGSTPQSLMTTTGDVLIASGPNTPARLAVGSTGQVLGVSAGLPAWETPANGYGIAGFAANPMTPAVALSYVESYIGSNVTLTASTFTNITSVSLAAGTWLINARVALAVATGSQFCEVWIGPTSASSTGAYAGVSPITNVSGVTWVPVSLSKVVVLGSPTTVYLTGYGGGGGAVAEWAGASASTPNSTGITAVRIV